MNNLEFTVRGSRGALEHRCFLPTIWIGYYSPVNGLLNMVIRIRAAEADVPTSSLPGTVEPQVWVCGRLEQHQLHWYRLGVGSPQPPKLLADRRLRYDADAIRDLPQALALAASPLIKRPVATSERDEDHSATTPAGSR